MRLIDADYLAQYMYDTFCKECSEKGAHCSACYMEDSINEVEQAPTVENAVVLPCKVGDFAWFFRGLIDDIKISKEPIAYILVDRDNQIKIQDVYGWYNEIGETVFLTEEEAEKALAERNAK